MSEKINNIIDKAEPVLSNPLAQKWLAAYTTGSGFALLMEYTESILAIISVVVGILAGVSIIAYNIAKIKHERAEEEKTRLESRIIEYDLRKSERESKTDKGDQ